MVTEQPKRSSILAYLSGLGWPLVIGLAGHSVLFLSIQNGLIDSPFIIRYLTSHPVAHIATGMFLVGLAALGLKLLDALAQFGSLRQVRLSGLEQRGQPVSNSAELLAALRGLPKWLHSSYIWRRLHDALQYVHRRQTVENLDEELKYLADQDEARQYESYSLVRILIWATPMMGFLGTVIGITLALENFGNQDFADLSGAMDVLLSSLYVAFDTTALALSLSIILMFVQFVIERLETQLLTTVDRIVAEQLVGRFEQAGTGTDPNVRTVHTMCQEVLRTTTRLVEQQSAIWKSTVDAAHDHWSQMSERSSHQLQTALTQALDHTLQTHAQRVAEFEQVFAQQLRQQWEKGQTALADNCKIMQQQQRELVNQGDVMRQIVQSTGEVINLERLLNENLKALAGAKHFEDTVMSLSAAIHLLTTRLDDPSHAARRVELTEPPTQGHAA